MKLTAQNVDKVFMDCLFEDGEEIFNPVVAEGVINKFGFHKDRLESHKEEIKEMLQCLPDEFHVGKGGGMSFLNACMDRDGNHWAEHINIEKILVLGIATGQASILMPREMWQLFPGGMPYFCVL